MSALVGVAGATVGSIAGSRWRQWAAPRFGSDWPAAVLEDALGIGLLAYLVATDASR